MKNRLLILTICLIATIKMMAQEFTLHGKVVDENNQPLEFAIVSVASQERLPLLRSRETIASNCILQTAWL